MKTARFFTLFALLASVGFQGRAQALDATQFCGPLLKTYWVQDLTGSRMGNGVRCVSPDGAAFYGEGFWGRGLMAQYKQMGIFNLNDQGQATSVQLIDLGLRRTDANSCQSSVSGAPGIRSFRMQAFSRTDLYGNFQTGYTLPEINERWIEATDTSVLVPIPLEGLKDSNDCMPQTGVLFAESTGGFRCLFSATVPVWVGRDSNGMLELGWKKDAHYSKVLFAGELSQAYSGLDLTGPIENVFKLQGQDVSEEWILKSLSLDLRNSPSY